MNRYFFTLVATAAISMHSGVALAHDVVSGLVGHKVTDGSLQHFFTHLVIGLLLGVTVLATIRLYQRYRQNRRRSKVHARAGRG